MGELVFLRPRSCVECHHFEPDEEDDGYCSLWKEYVEQDYANHCETYDPFVKGTSP